MTEAELDREVASWTGERTAEFGALCSDLAQIKLSKVCVQHFLLAELGVGGSHF